MEKEIPAKRNIKSMKDFKESSSLKKVKKFHARNLNIKGLEKISEQLELIEQITSTETLFKNSPVIKPTKDN